MFRRLLGASLAALLGVVALTLALVPAGADDKETPTVKDVMQKLNGKSAKAEGAKLRTALSKQSPNWKTVQSSTKEFATLSALLVKNEPLKGDMESWKNLTDVFATQCQALDEAAGKKDLPGTKSAFQKISISCMGCHRVHKK